MTKVVNVKDYKRKQYTLIDRTTCFGNPFVIGKHGGRKQVLELFKMYFEWRIKHDKYFRFQVEELKGKTLACWCKPLACHGDIIAEYLDSL